MSLTPKQQLFVDEYLIDLNATAAYKRAGYKAKNDNVAAVESAKLLRNPKIEEKVKEAMSEREKRTNITQDRVLQELARIAFFDARKLFDKEGKPIPINQLDDDTAAALAGLDVMEEYVGSGEDRVFVGYTKKYKVADKNTAITNAMRHLGMLKDKVEHTGKDGGPIEHKRVQELTDDELAAIAAAGSAGTPD
jgi:phage terminase small subunit